VLSVALAFFTQQFICDDIFNLRHSMLSRWWRWHHLTVCDAVYCGGNLPTFEVLCNIGKFPPQYTASHSRRLETSATPLQNFRFRTLYWWLNIKYYTASPFENMPTIRNRK
jgi:hypothetical protein